MALDARLISERFPYVAITLTVRDLRVEVDALLDTGFDGEIIVSADLIPPSMRPHRYLRWTLVDGSRVRALAYAGTIQIGELGTLGVSISAVGDEVLIGRRVIEKFRRILEYGERLILEP